MNVHTETYSKRLYSKIISNWARFNTNTFNETKTYNTMEIKGEADLIEFRKRINSGELDLNALCTNDITLTEPWIPISLSYVDMHYMGYFDGGNHSIRGLRVETVHWGGLFCQIGNSGVIKNVKIVDPEIVCGSCGGVITAHNAGTIINCHIINEQSSGSISSNSSNSIVGGITGTTKTGSQIINCSNEIPVNNLSSFGCVGGIIGDAEGMDVIIGCHNYGTIKGDYDVGGVIGHSYGETLIVGCINHGSITGNCGVGGIIGVENGFSNISQCINYGSIYSTKEPDRIGGIIGYMGPHTDILNCFNCGDIVDIERGYSGSIVGYAIRDNMIIACSNLPSNQNRSILGGSTKLNTIKIYEVPFQATKPEYTEETDTKDEITDSM